MRNQVAEAVNKTRELDSRREWSLFEIYEEFLHLSACECAAVYIALHPEEAMNELEEIRDWITETTNEQWSHALP